MKTTQKTHSGLKRPLDLSCDIVGSPKKRSSMFHIVLVFFSYFHWKAGKRPLADISEDWKGFRLEQMIWSPLSAAVGLIWQGRKIGFDSTISQSRLQSNILFLCVVKDQIRGPWNEIWPSDPGTQEQEPHMQQNALQNSFIVIELNFYAQHSKSTNHQPLHLNNIHFFTCDYFWPTY